MASVDCHRECVSTDLPAGAVLRPGARGFVSKDPAGGKLYLVGLSIRW